MTQFNLHVFLILILESLCVTVNDVDNDVDNGVDNGIDNVAQCRSRFEKMKKPNEMMVVLDSAPFGYDELTYSPKKAIFKDEYKYCNWYKDGNIVYLLPDSVRPVMGLNYMSDSSSEGALILERDTLRRSNVYNFSLKTFLTENRFRSIDGTFERSILDEWKKARQLKSPILKGIFKEKVIEFTRYVNVPITDQFRKEVENILNEKYFDKQNYLKCQLIRNYGAFYLNHVVLGGAFIITNYLNPSIKYESEEEILQRSDDYLTNTPLYPEFGSRMNDYVVEREIKTVGGDEIFLNDKLFYSTISMDMWQLWKKSLYVKPVPIKGKMSFIDDLVNEHYFPDHENDPKEWTWTDVLLSLQDEIREYNSKHRIEGCTSLNSPNFDKCAVLNTEGEKCSRIVMSGIIANEDDCNNDYERICSNELAICLCTKQTKKYFDQPRTIFGGITLDQNPCPDGFTATDKSYPTQDTIVNVCTSEDTSLLDMAVQVLGFQSCHLRCNEGNEVMIKKEDDKCFAKMCVQSKTIPENCTRKITCDEFEERHSEAVSLGLKSHACVVFMMFVALLFQS